MNSALFSFLQSTGKRLLVIMIFISLGGIAAIMRGDFKAIRDKLPQHPFFSTLIAHREQSKVMAKAMTLSFIQPSFEMLGRLIKNPGQLQEGSLDLAQISVYRSYYGKAIDYFPRMAELYALRGFCAYYLGDVDQSFSDYLQAVNLKPDFFWFYYNLGVLHLKREEYGKAGIFFEKALTTEMTKNVQAIYSSRVYQQIFWPVKNFGDYSVEKSLKEGYHHARGILQWIPQSAQERERKKRREKGDQFKEKLQLKPI